MSVQGQPQQQEQPMQGQVQMIPGLMMPGMQMVPAPLPMMIVPQMLVPVPSHIPEGTPPGLEFLLQTDAILIKQQIELAEVLLGFNTNNRYDIFNGFGQRIYFAAENSDACGILCLGNCRAWNITILNMFGQPVMTGKRESSCCGACGNSVQVASTSGQMYGGAIQNCECVSASWDITDETGAPVLRLQAPACSVCFPKMATCCEAEFPLMTPAGDQIGSITKHFGGLLREMYTAADTFGVKFPIDLDVKLKATLIYATFMIDFMYYENPPQPVLQIYERSWEPRAAKSAWLK